jgi:chromosome segregation ATPase
MVNATCPAWVQPVERRISKSLMETGTCLSPDELAYVMSLRKQRENYLGDESKRHEGEIERLRKKIDQLRKEIDDPKSDILAKREQIEEEPALSPNTQSYSLATKGSPTSVSEGADKHTQELKRSEDDLKEWQQRSERNAKEAGDIRGELKGRSRKAYGRTKAPALR